MRSAYGRLQIGEIGSFNDGEEWTADWRIRQSTEREKQKMLEYKTVICAEWPAQDFKQQNFATTKQKKISLIKINEKLLLLFVIWISV